MPNYYNTSTTKTLLANGQSPWSFNKASSVQWCVQFPTTGCSRKSPEFVIQDEQYYFRFDYLGNKSAYVVSLQTRRRLDVVWSITTLSTFTDKTNFEVCNCTVSASSDVVWTLHYQNSPRSDGITDLLLVRFIFIFDDIPGFSFQPPKPGIGNKLVQTDSISPYPDLDQSFADFSDILESSAFADVQLKCDGGTLYAHKGVLASRSEVFGRMFQADAADSSCPPVGVVEMSDADFSTVKSLLQFMYSGKTGDLSIEMAYPLYKLAKEYRIPPLKKACSDFMIKHLDEENS